MDKTFILPNVITDEMVTKLKRASFQALKKNLLDSMDSCKKVMGSDDIGGIETIEMLMAGMPEKVPLDKIESLYTAFERYGSINKDDPQKTVFKERFSSDIVENLENVQAAIFSLALKAKFNAGYDYSRVYDSSDVLDAKDQISKFLNEIRDFKCLFHISYEGITSGSVGPDEIERALSSLYAQAERITEHGEDIKEEYFS